MSRSSEYLMHVTQFMRLLELMPPTLYEQLGEPTKAEFESLLRNFCRHTKAGLKQGDAPVIRLVEAPDTEITHPRFEYEPPDPEPPGVGERCAIYDAGKLTSDTWPG